MMGDTALGPSKGGRDPAWGMQEGFLEAVTAPLRPEYECAGSGWTESEENVCWAEGTSCTDVPV